MLTNQVARKRLPFTSIENLIPQSTVDTGTASGSISTSPLKKKYKPFAREDSPKNKRGIWHCAADPDPMPDGGLHPNGLTNGRQPDASESSTDSDSDSDSASSDSSDDNADDVSIRDVDHNWGEEMGGYPILFSKSNLSATARLFAINTRDARNIVDERLRDCILLHSSGDGRLLFFQTNQVTTIHYDVFRGHLQELDALPDGYAPGQCLVLGNGWRGCISRGENGHVHVAVMAWVRRFNQQNDELVIFEKGIEGQQWYRHWFPAHGQVYISGPVLATMATFWLIWVTNGRTLHTLDIGWDEQQPLREFDIEHFVAGRPVSLALTNVNSLLICQEPYLGQNPLLAEIDLDSITHEVDNDGIQVQDEPVFPGDRMCLMSNATGLIELGHGGNQNGTALLYAKPGARHLWQGNIGEGNGNVQEVDNAACHDPFPWQCRFSYILGEQQQP